MAKLKTQKNKEQSDVSKIKALVDDAVALTTQWEQSNVKWHKMRMRIKKDKNFPFPGCANLRMPTIEIKLRKLKAALTNVVFGIRPVVQVVPNPGGNWETARKIEKFIDHLVMDVMKLKQKAIIAIDQALEKGFFVLKPFWKTEIISRTEDIDLTKITPQEKAKLINPQTTAQDVKQAIFRKFAIDTNPLVLKDNQQAVDDIFNALIENKTSVKVSFQDVLFNFPDISLCEPERVYVPTDCGADPQSAAWVIHEFYMPLEQVKTNGKYKGWSIGDIASIEDLARQRIDKSGDGKDKDIDSTKETREGIEQLDRTGKVKIWEFYGYYDIDGKGEKKCVITVAPDFDKVLRKIAMPFYSGKFPFVKLFYELCDDRWFSHRGIPELIEDIVKEIDMQHNQKLDQQTMRNSPMYVYRAGMVNKNTVQFVFGQGLPAQGMQPLNDLIMPINNNNQAVEFSYEREQMILESKVEELIGQVDFTLQSMINKRQPRTLGEVQLQNQNMQQVFSLDADLFRMGFEELFNWIWDLWCQYGDDTYEFSYFGKDGFEPIRLDREEVQGKYKITVRGNDQNTNPQIKQQKAQMIMAGMNNELAVQMGIIQPQNMANAYKRFFQEMDIPAWEELVSPPPPPQPQPILPMLKPKFKDLTDAEQAMALSQAGIQPDIQGRNLKSQAKIQEKQVEQEKMQAETAKTISDIFQSLGGDDEGSTPGDNIAQR